MKYKALKAVPREKRREYNAVIVNSLVSGACNHFSREEIFNYYRGKGGLHGLSRRDFGSYHAFGKAKRAMEEGQFFTPPDLCHEIVEALNPNPDHKIGDLTCGSGNFFNYLPEEKNIYGCEIDKTVSDVCKYLYPDANIHNGDFIYYSPAEKLDLIIGNPPFNLETALGKSEYAYLERAEHLLNYGGLVVIIVPATFLSDEFQEQKRIKWLNEHFNFVLQTKLPDNSFSANITTKLIIFQKKAVTNSNKPYAVTGYVPFRPQWIYDRFITPIYQQNRLDRSKIRLLTVRKQIADGSIMYKIKRRLWHIRENKILKRKYEKKAYEKMQQLETQQKPAGMSDKEWEHAKVTPEKILQWLDGYVKAQNKPPEQHKLVLVKTNYGLHYKAYSRKLVTQSWKKTVHDYLLNDELPPAPFTKLYRRKKKLLEMQLQSYLTMGRNDSIDNYLNEFSLLHYEENRQLLLFPEDPKPTIKLNQQQKNDLGLLFQKSYTQLAWEQGGGKSIAGMCWLRYLTGQYHNAFILAPAIAIEGTWMERLKWYGFDFVRITAIKQITQLKRGQIILLSHEKNVELARHLKQYVKRCAYKIALLVDESDELTNPNSQRTRAALKVFRKGKYKILTTGTTTRNNINELYPQYELLYNNSTAFLCDVEYVYRLDKEGKIVKTLNERRGFPFPAYQGSALFKSCYCPQKTTVFGIQKEAQDVYNAASLKRLINQTVVTRKFEEITGEKKYSIHTHNIEQTAGEKQLYQVLLKDFLQVCYDYYTSTGEARKEAALRLIRQIKVLIKAASIPHMMPNYKGTGLPGKYQAIIEQVRHWPQEIITIGTIFKQTARNYFIQLQHRYPHRKVFYIDGDSSIAKRKKILELLRISQNGILVCTQQSLKSSVNIPFCKKCIIESLQWNIPKMAQFYFRFIRFDSIGNTEVHFFNYNESIEINLMALLMAKEKLNDFIKTTNTSTTEDIYDEFGFDINILDSLLEKNYDQDGKLYLSWGNQRIG